ncbi:MAG: dTDP-4-dehydrorhamnose reductase, partial [Spirochaetota bacterium]|nr:dTDP-4-dehydrorhamnose reductase [Spirochaetota bacterium]
IGSELVIALRDNDYMLFPFTRGDLDICDRIKLRQALDSSKGDILINCGGFTQVDLCETESERAYQVNRDAVAFMAEECQRRGMLFVHLSSDYVFDGEKKSPYVESDPTNPLSVYGKSKLEGELAIESLLDNHLILRCSWVYGLSGKNFVRTIMKLASERGTLRVVDDQIGCPSFTKTIASGMKVLLKKGLRGTYHLSDEGICSWYQLAVEVVHLMRQREMPVMVKEIIAIPTSEYPTPAQRPAYSALSKEKILRDTGITLPHWKDSLSLFFNHYNKQ